MAEKVTIRACPYCGSMETYPALLFGGPIPWVDHNDGGYQCRHCGRTAVPLDFNSMEELKAFQKSLTTQVAESKGGFVHIPIMPVDTTALFRIPVIDLPIAQVAEVVEVEWDNGYAIKGGSAKFNRYWRAVQSPRYSAKEMVLLDLAGIQAGRPNFDVLKTLIKSKYQVWLDLGVRDIEDVFDCFAMDVSRTIIGTMTAPDLEVFEEAYDLSDRVVPCIHLLGDEVLWPSKRSGPRQVDDAVAALADIGFDTIGILDLRRIGRRNGVDHKLVEKFAQFEVGVILGGGVIEEDMTFMRSAGLSGAFMDPFTPVIEDIIHEEERELVTEDVTPATRPVAKGSPSPTD
jgi:uncharacterized protein related to proFAR isomerase